MKILLLSIATGSLLLLSGCACPRPGATYLEAPYGPEGTAGSGFVDEGCFRRAFT